MKPVQISIYSAILPSRCPSAGGGYMLEGECKMAESVIQIDTGKFTNVFLIRGRTGCVLVDTGNPGKADRILERLAKRGVAPDDIRLILVTHGHVDHFGSAAELRERTGAPVAVHALDAEAVRQGIHRPDSLHPEGRLAAFLMRISTLRALAVPDHAPASSRTLCSRKNGVWRTMASLGE
jgi:glyoxylase-like metal-dependent hydrolase (beta-lactamase superfamily II)